MLQKLRRNNQKAFTLIELMIVIAIIGILSSIAIPNFLEYRKKGQDAAALSTGQNFLILSMAYWIDKGPANFSPEFNKAIIKYAIDSDIKAGGEITMTGGGHVAGTATFCHRNSNKTYTIVASDGSVR